MKRRKATRWWMFVITGILIIAAAIYIYVPDFFDNLKSARTYDDLRDNYVEVPSEEG